jgi:FixJ family two-component response regulator
MKPTLEEMCEFLMDLKRTTPDDKDAQMLDAIWVRLSKEQGRRQKANQEKRFETLYKQINKKQLQVYREVNLKGRS